MTQCTPRQLEFPGVGRRRIVGRFDGGTLSSDAGALLLRDVEARTRLLAKAAACFTDYRCADRIEHTVEELVAQRVMGLALGYEDLNDHDELRHDALLAAVVGKSDPSGQSRERERDRGKALAGKNTLNRLELTGTEVEEGERYKKVVYDAEELDRLFVEHFVSSYVQAPGEVVLDVDATDDPVHGRQEGRFFHGYYRHYCYLPLYIFCGEHLLCARLRPANIDGAAGTVEELERIVAQLREAWPGVRIILRGDSGFCREALMHWCESNDVDYVLGLAKNARLNATIAPQLEQAQGAYEETGQPARVFADFLYCTRKSWSRWRRVVGKAEHLSKGPNPRFIVTTLCAEEAPAQSLYEQRYCARGDMENRIKEQQLALFADRTSAHTMRANQLRLYFSSLAYTLIQALRQLGLEGTALAKAQCDTIRLKLFKLAAHVHITVRNVWVSFSQSYPYAGLFTEVHHRLRAPP